jgi:hypothetical protein
LLMQEGLTASARKDAQAVTQIQRLAAAAGAELRTMSKHDLNMLSGNRCGLGSLGKLLGDIVVAVVTSRPLCSRQPLQAQVVLQPLLCMWSLRVPSQSDTTIRLVQF